MLGRRYASMDGFRRRPVRCRGNAEPCAGGCRPRSLARARHGCGELPRRQVERGRDPCSARINRAARGRVRREARPLDRFGVAKDVAVLLASHPLFDLMHESLAVDLIHVPGFAPAEPRHWRDGYHPHATLGTAVRAKDGDVLPIRSLTLVSLHEVNGRRRFAVDLS